MLTGRVQCLAPDTSLPKNDSPGDSPNEKHDVAELWNDFHKLRDCFTGCHLCTASPATGDVMIFQNSLVAAIRNRMKVQRECLRFRQQDRREVLDP